MSTITSYEIELVRKSFEQVMKLLDRTASGISVSFLDLRAALAIVEDVLKLLESCL